MDAMLSNGHWIFEDFKQRMTSREWRQLLLTDQDSLIFKGHMRKLKAKNLGSGVVEISKAQRNGVE